MVKSIIALAFVSCLLVPGLAAAVNFRQPAKSSSDIAEWAARAGNDVMTFGAQNFEIRRNFNRKYFTELGHMSFYQALNEAGIPQMMQERQMSATAKVTSVPMVKDPVMRDRIYEWEVTFPIAVTYHTPTTAKTDHLDVTLIVQETKDKLNEEKIGIYQWNAVPGKELAPCASDPAELLALKKQNEELKKRIEDLAARIEE